MGITREDLIREGAKIIGIYAGQDDGGAITFFAKKNEGAKTFFEQKNDGANAFFDEKNDGAETFFVRIPKQSFSAIDAFLSNGRCRMCYMLRYCPVYYYLSLRIVIRPFLNDLKGA